jgi:hypothetical protein
MKTAEYILSVMPSQRPAEHFQLLLVFEKKATVAGVAQAKREGVTSNLPTCRQGTNRGNLKSGWV